MSDIRYPDVQVELSDTDGNVFAIISTVKKAISRQVGREQAEAFAKEAMRQPSYDEVLQFCMRTVDVS